MVAQAIAPNSEGLRRGSRTLRFQCPDSRGIHANILIADDKHLVKSLDGWGVLRPTAMDPHVEDAITRIQPERVGTLDKNAAAVDYLDR
jgi:hypothetical protein